MKLPLLLLLFGVFILPFVQEGASNVVINNYNSTLILNDWCCPNCTCPEPPAAGYCPNELSDFPLCNTASNCMVECFWDVSPYNSNFCIKCGGDGRCVPDDQCPPPGVCNPATRICEQP